MPYACDNRGSLTSDGTWTYSYDGAGRMVRAEKPGSVYTYTYNGDGLLVSETIDGAETVFTWDPALDVPQVLGTSDGTRNLYGLERIGVEQGGGWRYTLADALGSVRQWTDPAGAVLGVQSYGPFGEPRDPVGTPPWGFTGEWQDPAGMVYLRTRWYDPTLGRFTQVDPVQGLLVEPATQHRYAYGLDNPQRYRDPSGKQPELFYIWWDAFLVGSSAEYNRQLGDLDGQVHLNGNAWALSGAFSGHASIYMPVDRPELIDWGSVFKAGFDTGNAAAGAYIFARFGLSCFGQALEGAALGLSGLLERSAASGPRWAYSSVAWVWEAGSWLLNGPPVAPVPQRGGNTASAASGNAAHYRDLPPQLRQRYPETEFHFAVPFERGPDVSYVGGTHPSQYPGSTWPEGFDYADFKPLSPSGVRRFYEELNIGKLMPDTVALFYDPKTNTLLSDGP